MYMDDLAMAQIYLDERSLTLFDQYRAVASKIKKRLLKKPNIREASDSYGKLANALKNEDSQEYAALCFSAMAKCNQLMSDSTGEAEAWAGAGHQFITAEEILYSSKSASYEQSLEAGVQCFQIAIQVHEKKGNDILAASFCLEIAHYLTDFKKFHEAETFFQKAAILQSEIPACHLQTLENLASCKIQLREYDSALGIYMKIIKETSGREGSSTVLHYRCEIAALLLLLILEVKKLAFMVNKTSIEVRKKSMVAKSAEIPGKYMKPEHNEIIKKYKIDLLKGSGSEKDVLLQSLVIATEEKDYHAMKNVRPMLSTQLDKEHQQLLNLLMELHSEKHAIL